MSKMHYDLESWLASHDTYRPDTWTGLSTYLVEIRDMLEGLESDNLQSLVLLRAIEGLALTASRDR